MIGTLLLLAAGIMFVVFGFICTITLFSDWNYQNTESAKEAEEASNTTLRPRFADKVRSKMRFVTIFILIPFIFGLSAILFVADLSKKADYAEKVAAEPFKGIVIDKYDLQKQIKRRGLVSVFRVVVQKDSGGSETFHIYESLWAPLQNGKTYTFLAYNGPHILEDDGHLTIFAWEP